MGLQDWITPLLLFLNLVLFPYFVLILVLAIGALLASRHSKKPEVARTRFLVVIPAHDEEVGIAQTVRSCLAVRYPPELFEIVVIADNCTDGTAGVARREGATVVERQDLSRRSKGYAIEYLIDRLQTSGRFDELDALVVIDADSTVGGDLLLGFAAAIEAGEDWIQCFYTVSNPEASWRTRLLAYAFSLFNGVRPLGHSTLGLTAGLRGNGMCFTTRGLRRVPWSSHGLVEDFEYSWNVCIAGGKVAFLPWVAVHGIMLEQGGKPAIIQRRRWEAGRRDLARRVLLPLLRSPRLAAIAKLIAAIELTTPPMVGLLLCYLWLVSANLLLVVDGSPPQAVSFVLVGFSILMSFAVVLYGLAPFLVFGLSWDYLLVLFYLPIYAVWKLLSRLHGRPTQWVRTPREQPVNH
jgi:cellulose synthase/poly-beta-1,6-N-acetylglucosamine synthase-like glycosyltransferase